EQPFYSDSTLAPPYVIEALRVAVTPLPVPEATAPTQRRAHFNKLPDIGGGWTRQCRPKLPDTQHQAIPAALDAARARFVRANPPSREPHRKAAAVLPGGNTRTSLFSDPFPVTLVRGGGARVPSLDGREYSDFLGEYTAGLYGHSHPALR